VKSNRSGLTRRLQRVLAPVSKAEERRAMKSAIDYFVNKRNSDDVRYRVLGATLRVDKPPQPAAVPPRLIDVYIADYDDKRNLAIVVDRRGKVVRSETLGFQPAFHVEEIAEARQIAEQDERVARLAKRRGLFVSDFGPSPMGREDARLIGLRYAVARAHQRFVHLASVVVDLSERKIVHVEILPDYAGGLRG
jgi:hypothetical protein